MEDEFTLKVVAAIRSIPEGKVSNYGEIAKQAGNPRGAREVAAVLDSQSKTYALPWHRVINVEGGIAINNPDLADKQKKLLEAEGIIFVNDKVDMAKYLFNPNQSSLDNYF